MNTIRRKVKVIGPQGSRKIEAIFDLKVMETYLRKDIADHIGTPFELSQPSKITLSNRDEELSVKHFMALEIELNGRALDWCFKVVDRLPHALVVGSTMMSSRHIVLDLINKDLLVESPPVSELIY